MSKSLVEHFVPTESGPPAQKPVANENRRPPMMMLIEDSDGAQWLEPYAYLLEVYMPTKRTALHLRFTHRVVTIEGIRLQALLLELHKHRVSEIAPILGNAADFPDPDSKAPHITKISVRKRAADDSD